MGEGRGQLQARLTSGGVAEELSTQSQSLRRSDSAAANHTAGRGGARAGGSSRDVTRGGFPSPTPRPAQSGAARGKPHGKPRGNPGTLRGLGPRSDLACPTARKPPPPPGLSLQSRGSHSQHNGRWDPLTPRSASPAPPGAEVRGLSCCPGMGVSYTTPLNNTPCHVAWGSPAPPSLGTGRCQRGSGAGLDPSPFLMSPWVAGTRQLQRREVGLGPRWQWCGRVWDSQSPCIFLGVCA